MGQKRIQLPLLASSKRYFHVLRHGGVDDARVLNSYPLDSMLNPQRRIAAMVYAKLHKPHALLNAWDSEMRASVFPRLARWRR